MMINHQAMQELKELLVKTFPDEIERVILFGSRVKGTAEEYSDYDVLLIVKHEYDWRFEDRIYDTTWEIDFKHDIFTDVKVISSERIKAMRRLTQMKSDYDVFFKLTREKVEQAFAEMKEVIAEIEKLL